MAVPGKYNIRFQVLVVQEIPCHVDPGNSILRQCGPRLRIELMPLTTFMNRL